jgi:hypothetical protein
METLAEQARRLGITLVAPRDRGKHQSDDECWVCLALDRRDPDRWAAHVVEEDDDSDPVQDDSVWYLSASEANLDD